MQLTSFLCISQGLYKSAEASYKDLLKKPDLAPSVKASAMRQLGWLYHSMANDAESGDTQPTDYNELSISFLQKALTVDREDGQAWYFLGRWAHARTCVHTHTHTHTHTHAHVFFYLAVENGQARPPNKSRGKDKKRKVMLDTCVAWGRLVFMIDVRMPDSSVHKMGSSDTLLCWLRCPLLPVKPNFDWNIFSQCKRQHCKPAVAVREMRGISCCTHLCTARPLALQNHLSRQLHRWAPGCRWTESSRSAWHLTDLTVTWKTLGRLHSAQQMMMLMEGQVAMADNSPHILSLCGDVPTAHVEFLAVSSDAVLPMKSRAVGWTSAGWPAKQHLYGEPIGLVRTTSWYPYFDGRHFGLPSSEIHRMTGLPPKIVWTMTYSHRPHLQACKLLHVHDPTNTTGASEDCQRWDQCHPTGRAALHFICFWFVNSVRRHQE